MDPGVYLTPEACLDSLLFGLHEVCSQTMSLTGFIYLCMYLSTRVKCLSRGYSDSPGDEVDKSGLAIFVCGSQQSHAIAIKTIALRVCHFCSSPAVLISKIGRILFRLF